MKQQLTITKLIEEAKFFCESESNFLNHSLFGITDGKAVGTFIEHKFKEYLADKYVYSTGNAAFGIDLPDENLNTDIKVTSVKQPQSSCPFRDAKQKIYGLGYNLLVFVYDKIDDSEKKAATLKFVSCSFIAKERTADYQTTYYLRQLLEKPVLEEEIIAYLVDKNIPADDITLQNLAKQIIENPPIQGYLTISNALQWRLQYGRIVSLNEPIEGIKRIIQ